MERALVGDESLGMTAVDDHASPIHGLIPIPPILDNQIDRVTIIWMETLIQKVLKLLGSKISAKKSGNWFELFLAIMVLLVTAECTAKEQETFISEFATAVSLPTFEITTHGGAAASHSPGRHVEAKGDRVVVASHRAARMVFQAPGLYVQKDCQESISRR